MKKNIVASNRKARHNFTIEETYEAGVVLTGTEVKSLRAGHANISDSYADEQNGELYLINTYIPEYEKANKFNHQPRRYRKLLLHKRQINKLIGKVATQGYTLVALSIYFNEKKFVKVEIGLAVGKKKHDKRQAIKERDWNRNKSRILKDSLKNT